MAREALVKSRRSSRPVSLLNPDGQNCGFLPQADRGSKGETTMPDQLTVQLGVTQVSERKITLSGPEGTGRSCAEPA